MPQEEVGFDTRGLAGKKPEKQWRRAFTALYP
jgi:hypothetical protein